MAQTKRKRRTKHRGNAVGMVEVRGRTGRKPTSSEKGGKPGTGKRPDRRDQPPTWTGAVQRSAIAAVLFVVLMAFLFHRKPLAAVAFGAVLLIFYVPMSYYTDLWIYRRHQARKARKAGN
jgi:hypothetical protein